MVFDARAIDGSAVSASPDASQANRVPWRSRARINRAHDSIRETNARGHMFGPVGVVVCAIVAVLVFSDIAVAHFFLVAVSLTMINIGMHLLKVMTPTLTSLTHIFQVQCSLIMR